MPTVVGNQGGVAATAGPRPSPGWAGVGDEIRAIRIHPPGAGPRGAIRGGGLVGVKGRGSRSVAGAGRKALAQECAAWRLQWRGRVGGLGESDRAGRIVAACRGCLSARRRGCSSVVERQLPKLNVEGSSPFTRFSMTRLHAEGGDGPTKYLPRGHHV